MRRWRTPPAGTLDAPVRVLQVGRDTKNQAIVALAVRTAPIGLAHSAFICVANMGMQMASRRLELYADGVLRDSRDAGARPERKTDISIDDIDDPDHPASVVEVRLVADEAPAAATRWRLTRSRSTTAAWAIIPPAGLRTVLLVGDGRPVPRDRALLPARHRAVRRDPGQLRPGHEGMDLFDLVDLRGLAARRAARQAHPRHRPARVLGPRHG